MSHKPIQRKNNQHIDFINKTKSYISCNKCRNILNIHHKEQQRQPEPNRVSSNLSEYHYIPPSELCNIKISSNQEQVWILLCETCEQQVGRIGQAGIMFRRERVMETVIKYEKIGDNHNKSIEQKQGKCVDKGSKSLKQAARFQQKVKKYLACSFQVLERQLGRIKTEQSEKLQKQLQNFIKFYRKWTNREHRNTKYPESSSKHQSHLL